MPSPRALTVVPAPNAGHHPTSKFDVEGHSWPYANARATTLARADLKGAGPLLVSDQHLLVQPLSLVNSARFPNRFSISLRLVHELLLNDLVFDATVDALSLPWYVEIERLSVLFFNVIQAGFDTSVRGTIATRMEISRCVSLLSSAQRTLVEGEVHHIGSDIAWLNLLPASRIRGIEPSNRRVAQFMGVLVGGFVDKASHSAAPFSDVVEMLVTSAVDVAASSLRKALIVLREFFDGNHLPPLLDRLVPMSLVLEEVDRRHAPLPQSRFYPLFVTEWRIAYPSLGSFMPSSASGMEAWSAIGLLSASTGGVSSDILHPEVLVLDEIIRSHVASVDTLEFSGKTTEFKILEMARIHQCRRHESSSVAQSSSEIVKPSQKEDWSLLMADVSFKELNSLVQAYRTNTADGVQQARTLLADRCAAGFLFLNGKYVQGWDFLNNARQEHTLHSLFNAALQQDERQVEHPDWGNVLPLASSLDARKKYKLALLLASASFEQIECLWTSICYPWLLKCEGQFVAKDLAPSSLSSGKWLANDALWLDVERLEYAETPMRLILNLHGHSQGRSLRNSFSNLWGHIRRRAKSLRKIDDRLPPKLMLQELAVNAANAALADFSNHMKGLKSSLIIHAQKSEVFVLPESTYHKLDAEFDSEFTSLREEISRFEKSGITAASRMGLSSPASSVSLASIPPLVSPALDRPVVSSSTGTNSSVVSGLSKSVSQVGRDADAYPPGVSAGWGDCSLRLGIVATDAGLAFGKSLVTLRGSQSVDVSAIACPAMLAPSRFDLHRGKWCIHPTVCKGHPRPAGITEEDVEVSAFDSSTPHRVWVAANDKLPPLNLANRGKGAARGRGRDGGRGRGAGRGRTSTKRKADQDFMRASSN